jgi:hypothetical protein
MVLLMVLLIVLLTVFVWVRGIRLAVLPASWLNLQSLTQAAYFIRVHRYIRPTECQCSLQLEHDGVDDKLHGCRLVAAPRCRGVGWQSGPAGLLMSCNESMPYFPVQWADIQVTFGRTPTVVVSHRTAIKLRGRW